MRGRPAGATSKGKTDRTSIQVRVTAAERKAFEAEALRREYALGEWIRQVLRREAGLWTGQKEERTMDKPLTAEQIEAALDTLGETGFATVKNGGLYTRREENADERFVGPVADEQEAKAVIQAWYDAG